MVKISAVSFGLTLMMLTVSRTSCQQRELLILLDDSDDITDAGWIAIKQDLISLVLKVCGIMAQGPFSTNLSLATFSSTVQHRFNSTEVSTTQRPMYINAIRGMTQTRGTNRCLGRALDYATEFLSSLPPSTQRVSEVLVLTAGLANCPGYHDYLANAVKRLQTRAFVFALQVGSASTEMQSMEAIVSKPLINHIFSLSNFFLFHGMVDIIKTYPDTCIPFELS